MEAILLLLSWVVIGGGVIVVDGFLAMFFGLIYGVVELLINLCFFSSSRSGQAKIAKPSWFAGVWKSKAIKWGGRALIGLSIICLIGLLLLETVLFQPALRYLAVKQQSVSGSSITFSTVEGSFLKRDFEFNDLRITGQSEKARYNVEVDQLSVDVAGVPWSMPRQISELAIKNMSGELQLLEQTTETRAAGKSKTRTAKKRKKRPFTIESLVVDGCTFNLTLPGEPESLPMEIQTWSSSPIRSRVMGFDLLFRTNLDATIGDTSIKLVTSEQPDGRKTSWLVNDLDVRLLQLFFDEPWGIFETGQVDIEVQDSWAIASKSEDTFIDMDWQMQLSDVALREQESKGLMKDLAAAGFRKYLASKMENDGVELGFTMRIRDGAFEGSATDALQQVWDEALSQWGQKWLKLDEQKTEELKSKIKSVGEFLKDRMDKKKP